MELPGNCCSITLSGKEKLLRHKHIRTNLCMFLSGPSSFSSLLTLFYSLFLSSPPYFSSLSWWTHRGTSWQTPVVTLASAWRWRWRWSCPLTPDGCCPGAVVQDGQLSKHLSRSHRAQLRPLLGDLHLPLWAADTSTDAQLYHPHQ